MGAYQYLVDLGKARRLEAEEKGLRKAQVQVRKWIEEGFREQGLSEDEIQGVLQLLDALEKKRKD